MKRMEHNKPEPNYAQVLHQPFFDELSGCNRILLAGCGGGYDFFSAIPLFYALEKAGATCFLANLTFSSPDRIVDTEKITDVCYKVTADSKRSTPGWSVEHDEYWPEAQVSYWFKKNENRDVPVYMLLPTGVQQLKDAYEKIVNFLQIDAIVLCDGGTDSLMFGDECGLGTPTEDMTSIASVHQLDVKKKFLVNLGFGIDCFHGVVHSHYLENVATITRAGGFLGSFSLHPSMEEAQKFEAIYSSCNPENSIVCSSVLSAVQGKFANTHSPYTKSRTLGSRLYISALMSMYFTFKLEVVANHVMYLKELYPTKSLPEVRKTIHKYCVDHGYFNEAGKYIGERKQINIPY